MTSFYLKYDFSFITELIFFLYLAYYNYGGREICLHFLVLELFEWAPVGSCKEI